MKLKLGDKIATFRKAKGLTQEQLAASLGVSPPAVSKWETGNSYPDITLLCPLARALNTDVDTLLDFETDLPEDQLSARMNEIVKTARDGDIQAADSMLTELLHQYPSSVPLKYQAVYILITFEFLASSNGEEKKAEWKNRRKELLQSVHLSGDPVYWQSAVTELAAIALTEQKPDEAEALLKELPERLTDPTLVWTRLYLMRDEKDQAKKTIQKRLYQLVYQLQNCLIYMADEKMEPDPERALRIGEIYCQVNEMFGLGSGMGAGILAELYRRTGDKEKAMESLCRLVDALTSYVKLPEELLFSTMTENADIKKYPSKEMKQMLLKALNEDEAWYEFYNDEKFQEAVKNLRDSIIE